MSLIMDGFLAGLHFVAFVCLMLGKTITMYVESS
jgi:hypothetical protein